MNNIQDGIVSRFKAGIPQNVTIKNLEDTVIKIFEKIGISIDKRMIAACHRIGKTTKTIVKFANRKDAELVLKSKKKLKDINLLEICGSTDGNCSLSSRETDSDSENVDVSEKNRGRKLYIYQSLCPIIGSFTVRLRNDITKDSFTTSG